MKIPITNFLSIVGLHLQGFNFLFLKFLKLIPFAAFSIFFAGLFSCKDLKEERSGPTLVTTWDTTVTFFNFILPGDSLILTHSLASTSEKNRIIHKVEKVNLDNVEFTGPDSDYVFTREHEVSGKFLDKFRIKELVTGGIRPGLYKFISQAKNQDGNYSKINDFEYPLNNVNYPFMVIDTPLNGYRSINRIALDTFKVKVRAFGPGISQLDFQWYDSLKANQIEEPETFTFEELRNDIGFSKNQIFPKRAGKLFYLKAAVTTKSQRSGIYWIPFERTRQ
jgi:hypothetical protein